MKAIGYKESLPISEAAALEAFELPDPQPGPRDLLVEVKAISVNPVDFKVRKGVDPKGEPKILGWDASGIVRAVGTDVTLFEPGDGVYYAGAIDRQGANSELHIVDERIVGRRPKTLSDADAAALPLTTITAWELLFDRFGIAEGGGVGDTLLAIGGAGGVGSILIQLARQLTGLTVVATASRPETRAWVEAMGAHYVVDHREDLPAQIDKLGLAPRYVAGLAGTEKHFPTIAELLAPQGKFGLVDDPDPRAIDVMLLKQKAISLHWEFMFTRSLFQTVDMIEQHHLLNRVADLVDQGRIRTTANHHVGNISVQNLRKAHQHLESGAAVGKSVLEGWS